MADMEELLVRLDKLQLPDGHYAIFGSGPLAVRGWKEPGDLDVIVSSELWDDLASKHTVTKLPDGGGRIEIGYIELFDSWGPDAWDIEQLIAHADLIEGHRYVQLSQVLLWKLVRGKDKDIPDIKILTENGVHTIEPPQ